MTNKSNNYFVLFLLSAPRSGINMLSSALNICGISHATDPNLVHVTHQILCQGFDRQKMTIGPLSSDQLASPSLNKAKERIRTLLLPLQKSVNTDFFTTSTFMISDTYLCHALPFWLEIIDDTQPTLKACHLIRHPHEVALSLREHQGMDLEKGHLVWLAYIREALRNLQGLNCVTITFDQLLADPVSTLQTVLARSNKCATPFEISPSFTNWDHSVNSKLLDFVQPKLKHHHIIDLSESDAKKFKPYADFYTQLRSEIFQFDPLLKQSVDNGAMNQSRESFGLRTECVLGNSISSGIIDNLLRVVEKQSRIYHSLSPLNYVNDASGDMSVASLPLPGPAASEAITQPTLCATFFLPSSEGSFPEKHYLLLSDQWQKIECKITKPELLNQNGIKFRPLSTSGAVSLTDMHLACLATGRKILEFNLNDTENFHVEGTTLRVPGNENIDLLITGNSSQIIFNFADNLPNIPLQFVLWIKPSLNQLNLLKDTSVVHYVEKHDTKKPMQRVSSRLWTEYPYQWVQRILSKTPLTWLSDITGSDKGFRKHLYTTVYNELLNSKKIKTFLEIGLLCHVDQHSLNTDEFTTAPSLDMWSQMLPDAKIYGFDIMDFSKAKGNWEQIFRGDQAKREDLQQIVQAQDQFDVIMDDGLHASMHQQITFSFLFQYLSPSGYFFIEDLHFQPDIPSEANAPKTLALLKELAATGKWNSPFCTQEEKDLIEQNVGEILFYDSMRLPRTQSIDALCLIKKMK